MILSHTIRLDPTPEQAGYFGRAAGTARFVWNWALDEWNRQYASGQKPNAMALKKQFNTIKYREFPWIKAIHRDAHAQPFAYLAKAWNRFFADIKAGKPGNEPRFKKKGRCRDSFYVANDKFTLSKESVRLPKIGEVAMMEALRFDGKSHQFETARNRNCATRGESDGNARCCDWEGPFRSRESYACQRRS